MEQRESILPLLLGAFFALAVHVAGLGGYVAMRDRPIVTEPAQPQADMAIAALQLHEPLTVGVPTQGQILLQNLGDAAGVPVRITLDLDGKRIKTLSLDTPLDPGAEHSLPVQFTVDRPGLHAVKVTVDPSRAAADRDRSNNTLQAMHIWLEADHSGAELPDLLVGQIEVAGVRRVGEPSEMRVTIANTGGHAGGEVALQFVMDRQLVLQSMVPTPLPGQVMIYSAPLEVTEAGKHELRAFIDAEQAIAESDETNNQMARTFTWEPEKEKLRVGQLKPSELEVNWIDAEDARKLLARRADFDQAAVQREVDPVPDAGAPLNPTPPLPQPSPRANPAVVQAQPRELQQAQPSEPSPSQQAQPPTVPVPPDRIADRPPQQAPALSEKEAPIAAAPTQGPAAPPSRIEAQGLETNTPRIVVDQTASPQPVDATAAAARNDRLQVLETIPLEPQPSIDPTFPDPLQSPTEREILARRAPQLPPQPNADPTDRSAAIESEPRDPVQIAALPLPPNLEQLIGSPELKAVQENAPDRETTQPMRQVDPTRPAVEGTIPKPQQQTETTVPNPSPPQPQPSPTKPQPTTAPKDERESPPVSTQYDWQVRPGQVMARRGIKVNTVQPRYLISAAFSLKQNPDVIVVFNREGKVIYAEIVKTSGSPTIDGPLLNSLYKWSATGDTLKTMNAEEFRMPVHILLRAD